MTNLQVLREATASLKKRELDLVESFLIGAFAGIATERQWEICLEAAMGLLKEAEESNTLGGDLPILETLQEIRSMCVSRKKVDDIGEYADRAIERYLGIAPGPTIFPSAKAVAK